MRQSHQQQNEKRNQSLVQDKKPKNAFAALYEDDEPVQVEETVQAEAEVEVKVEVFGPSLCSKPAESKPVLGYAAAVNKKPVEPWMKNITVKIEPKKAITNEKQWAPLSKTSVNVDWAADSDSDEDW
jgi:tRNA A37 threonylcarbamoyladenosine modification protein TsaB